MSENTSPSPPGWIVANLDAEAELAGITPPRRALETAAAFGTLLRVFARPGDRLLLPTEVDPELMAQVSGLERPELLAKAPARLLPGPLLAWCETRRIQRLRSPQPVPLSFSPDESNPWHLPHATPRTAAAVHHRRFHLRLARHLREALPGASWINSRDELENHLKTTEAALGPGGAWVLKAPFSAAGRHRVYGEGRNLTQDLRAVDAFLRRFKGALFEPWLQRQADFGLTGFLTDEGPRHLALHRLLVHPKGAFAGIELAAAGTTVLPKRQQHELLRCGERIARAIGCTGFRGAFGIDGFVYQDHDGTPRLHPLGEINARLTFGHIARALVRRLDPFPGSPVRLRLGTEAEGAPLPLLHGKAPRSPRLGSNLANPQQPTHRQVRIPSF